MSNNPNMSYCRFHNTLAALRQCNEDMSVSSDSEKTARRNLIDLCRDIVEYYGEYEDSDFWDKNEEDDDE